MKYHLNHLQVTFSRENIFGNEDVKVKDHMEDVGIFREESTANYSNMHCYINNLFKQ